MKKILLSLLSIGAVAVVAVYASQAFFSDTETSTGNKFVAGDIDLEIDNESYAIDCNIPANPYVCTGKLAVSDNTTWSLKDLTVEKFFDFIDLKPGDFGEDTISIHVGSNDAWLCAAARITEDSDNNITEPEDEVAGANNDNNDGTSDGDLDSGLQFAFWVDDGDNVLERCGEGSECDPQGLDDEAAHVFLTGTLADMGKQGKITLADSASSILGQAKAVPGGTTFYIAKAWCYGTLTLDPVPQDGANDKTNPIEATGVKCNGSSVGNIGQTDSVVGDLQFYAVQSRNNPKFLCSSDYIPVQ